MTSGQPAGRRPDHRALLFASLIAGVSYFFAMNAPLPDAAIAAWKGTGVGLLAVYALLNGRNGQTLAIAAVMAIGATADMVLEFDMIAGGAVFALGHVVAIALYLRQRRLHPSNSQWLAAVGLALLIPLIAFLFVSHLPGTAAVTVYAALVGSMAGSAWLSRYPRYRTGIGAVLFAISDLLIFARMGGQLPESLTSWLIWPLYFGGQFLIVTGVVGSGRVSRG